MKSAFTVVLLLVLCAVDPNCHAQKLPYWNAVTSKIVVEKANQICIVHYFATWCAPCMKELPVFDSLRKVLTTDNTQFVFISMDLKNTKKLAKTLSNFMLPGRIFYLSPSADPHQLIHPNASGVLPSTVVYYPFGEPILIEGKMMVSDYLKILP